jgi:hypothetical protein
MVCRSARAVTDQLMGHHAAHVVQHEREAGVFKYRPVAAAQDVLQVRGVVFANLAHVGVESRFPGAVAHLPRELGEVLRVAELVAVEALQPPFPADLAQVDGERLVVNGRARDQENVRLHVPHSTAPYLAALPASCVRMSPAGVRPRRGHAPVDS